MAVFQVRSNRGTVARLVTKPTAVYRVSGNSRGPRGPQGETGPQGPQGEVGPQGPQGEQGESFVWEGDWAISTAYAENDIVISDGIAYVCFAAHTSSADDEPDVGVNEGDYWLRISGPQGPTGDPGAPGEQGEQGETGEAGVYFGDSAPSDTSLLWVDTDEDYPVYSWGSIGGTLSDQTDLQTALDAKAALAGATFTGDIIVPNEVYGAGWDGSNEVPTKNAIYDKIETIAGTAPQIIVVADDAPASWLAVADYVCDGTADNVEIQDAIDDSEAGLGEVLLSPGTFNIAAGLTIVGNDDYTGPQVTLLGQGQEVTKLVGANDVDIITMNNSAKVNIQSFTLEVNGTGDALRSTDVGTLMRGFHFSMFKNLYILGDTSHSGWGMDLDNAFRSTFENIEMFNVDNGLRITATDATFNPGDCQFTRMFIELNSNNDGVGIHLTSSVASVNQINFDMVELIDSGTGGTGILLDGTVGPNHNIFRGVNIEQFTTTINVQSGYGNKFDLNHITPVTNFVIFGTNANGNIIERVGFLAIASGSVAVLDDNNTWPENPNVFQNVYMGVEAGATATVGDVAMAIIRDMHGYHDGTTAPILLPYNEGQQKYPKTVALTDGATPALDASLGNFFSLSAGGNRTIAIPTNPKPNQMIIIAHTASGGARTLALNTGTGGFAFGTDITALSETGSGLTDYIGAIYDSTANKWRVVSYVKGY